mgnify:CR=1 FL=1
MWKLFRRPLILIRTCPTCGNTVKIKAQRVSQEEINEAYKEDSR